MKNTFKIGDKVMVIRSGRCYSTYSAWAKKHKLKLYKLGNSLNDEDIGEVVAIGRHDTTPNQIILGILMNNKHFMIGVEGVVLCKKHKHHAVIIAYANGDKIQTRFDKQHNWEDVEYPHFYDHIEYRIKSEPKSDLIVNAMMSFKHDWKTPEVFTSWNGLEIPAGQKHIKNLDYLEHIRFTFDGETNELKSVELIK